MIDTGSYPSKHLRAITLAALAALMFALGPARSALAHPLGNFTVNHYTRIELTPEGITLRYVVDMAEIPTFQESALIDLNHDGRLDPGESAAYLKTKAEQLRQGVSLQVDGQPAALEITSESITFPAGQGGLPTTRMVIDMAAGTRPQAAVPPAGAAGSGGSHALDYRDNNYADRLGWREIILRGTGVTLAHSSVPSTDRSSELTAYPEDMLISPMDVREAHATFAPGAGVAPASPSQIAGAPAANILDRSCDDLAALIATQELSLPVVLLALIAAAGLGALHSLSPGHGKTVVGAYLVGSRGTARHALFLGLTVTLTHTAGVFALGLVTLFASQFILPEQLYPWLSLLSGLFVALIGISLFVTRLRSFLTARAAERAAGGAMRPGRVSLLKPAPALALAAAGAAAAVPARIRGRAQALMPSRFHASCKDAPALSVHEFNDPPVTHSHAVADVPSLAHFRESSGHAAPLSHSVADSLSSTGVPESHDATARHSYAGTDGASSAHDHRHGDGHVHTHPGEPAHSHSHVQPHSDSPVDAHPGEPAHSHSNGHTHMHSHAGGRPHSHLPVDAQGNVIDTISWRNLLALGISGGLLPCPSALVVLLAAISLHRVAFGLLLIVAFSAGLAGVLTAIGLLLVYAGRQFERVRAPGALIRLLPAGSALVVTALGMLILIEALGQVGLIR